MSSADNVAMKIKLEKCGLERVEKILRDDDVEIVHFNRNSYMYDEAGDHDITKEQLDQLDRILTQNHTKLFGSEASHVPSTIIPTAQNVDFIEKGKIIVRVMDNHNFYEAETYDSNMLVDAPIGLLTKLWISISRAAKE